MPSLINLSLAGLLLLLFFFVTPKQASAHCDTLNGPVVTAGQKALDTGNVNYVLIWVKKEDEEKITEEFKQALKRRKASGSSGDTQFFESLVKIHREGEGAEYTGLKPAGAVEPEIAAADEAVASGNINPILSMTAEKYHTHLIELFERLKQSSNYDVNDVAAGREHVENYVIFVHTVEAAAKGAELTGHDVHSHTEEATVAQAAIEPKQEAGKFPKSTPILALLGTIGAGIVLWLKKGMS